MRLSLYLAEGLYENKIALMWFSLDVYIICHPSFVGKKKTFV